MSQKEVHFANNDAGAMAETLYRATLKVKRLEHGNPETDDPHALQRAQENPGKIVNGLRETDKIHLKGDVSHAYLNATAKTLNYAL